MPTVQDYLSEFTLPRIKTGIPELDASLRGGIPFGKRWVIGGAPGAGKTGLLLQLAVDFARQGCKVVVLATDEGAPGLAVRLGQMAGESRDILENPGPLQAEAHARVQAAIEQIPFTLEHGKTIEQAVRLLGPDGPRALLVDSLQTATCAEHYSGARGKKSKVEATIKAFAKPAENGILVVCTSELNREGYKRGKAGDISSGKGSGDIEYAFDLFHALRVSGPNEVHLTTPKSRIGGEGTFEMTLHLDRQRCRLYSEETWTAMQERNKKPRALPPPLPRGARNVTVSTPTCGGTLVTFEQPRPWWKVW